MPLVPKLSTVPEVVRAGPLGVRDVVPMRKPEGRGVKGWLAAVKIDGGIVGGEGLGVGVGVREGIVRVVEPKEGLKARMAVWEEGRRV